MGSRLPYDPHICTCPVHIGWGYLYPEPLLHNDYNTPTCPEYPANIPGCRSFHTGWSVQIVYPIRFVIETLLRSFEVTFGSAVDLRSPSWTFGVSRRPSARLSFGNLRPRLLTIGAKGNLRSQAIFRTFGSRYVASGNLRYPRR